MTPPAARRGLRYAQPSRAGRAAPYLIVAGLIVVLAVAVLARSPERQAPPVALAPLSAITIEHFMTGLACIESSGRYTAVNSESGAIGKYQIMPRNWRTWAARFLDDASAEPSPQNQEIVARTRIQRLYTNLGSWRRVAYWWLTGRTGADETRWSDKARGYVDRVIEVAARAATPELAGAVPARCRPVPATSRADR